MLFVKSGPVSFHPNPNADEMWSKRIFKGLSFDGIYLRLMLRELEDSLVIFKEVSFEEVSNTRLLVHNH